LSKSIIPRNSLPKGDNLPMDSIGSYLRRNRNRRGISLPELSKSSGVSLGFLSDVENDKKKPGLDILQKLLSSLKLDFLDLLTKTGYLSVNTKVLRDIDKSGYRLIPLVKWESAGLWKESDKPEGWMATDEGGDNLYALQVKDESMTPLVSEGEKIIIDPDEEVKSGDYILVMLSQNNIVIRQLKVYDGVHVLHPLNTQYTDQVIDMSKVTILGKVISRVGRLR
jgi:SOS-response transcriptional repressor LexA